IAAITKENLRLRPHLADPDLERLSEVCLVEPCRAQAAWRLDRPAAHGRSQRPALVDSLVPHHKNRLSRGGGERDMNVIELGRENGLVSLPIDALPLPLPKGKHQQPLQLADLLRLIFESVDEVEFDDLETFVDDPRLNGREKLLLQRGKML